MTKQDFAEALAGDRFSSGDPDQTLIAAWVGVVLAQILGYKLYRKLGAPKWAAWAIATFAANKAWADLKRDYKRATGF